jgi:hypothetical protein
MIYSYDRNPYENCSSYSYKPLSTREISSVVQGISRDFFRRRMCEAQRTSQGSMEERTSIERTLSCLTLDFEQGSFARVLK